MTIRLTCYCIGSWLPLVTLALIFADEPEAIKPGSQGWSGQKTQSRAEEEVLQQRLQRMEQAIESLQHADQVELATEVLARAKTVTRELQAMREESTEGVKSRGRADPQALKESQWRVEVIRRLDKLCQQVHDLREEVGGLRQSLDERRRHEEEARFGQVDLSGQWIMTLPAGYEYETLITPHGEDLYQVNVRGNLTGLYRHHGNRLSIETPRQRRLTEFVWEIRNKDLLLLTEAPPVAKVGSDYRGAILRRISDDPTSAVNKKATEKPSKESDGTAMAETAAPNIILILTDDQGYGDVGCFGAEGFQTPHLDRLAREGRRFTDFYVAASVCTASRAALMTGCYPNRVSMFGALNHTSREGIHPNELLLPEILQTQGYATACYGKWHLGTVVEFFPTRNGFDEFFGIPYSNDNSKYHPVAADMPPLPLCENETIIACDPDQRTFTRRLTEKSVNFIKRQKDRPFFLYVPHIMPHVPIFASETFQGSSAAGLYGDVIQEIDWSVGQIVEAIEELGLARKTLIIFFSDNGPFLSYGEHAGHAKPLREGKLTTFEGGFRSPCIMRWTGHIPASTICSDVVSSMDLLPTIAQLVDHELPHDRTIDGRDIWPLISGAPGAKSPHDALYFYAGTELQAVRAGDYKLHFPHQYLTTAAEPGRGGFPSNHGKLEPLSITSSGLAGIASRHGYRVVETPKALFHLRSDPGESRNLISQHPEIAARLEEMSDGMRKQLGDSLTNSIGDGIRPRATIFDISDPRLLIPRTPSPGIQPELIRSLQDRPNN